MKKILVVHTKYKIKGGEDSNIWNEIEFLKKNFEVELLFFDNSSKLNIFDIISFFTISNFKSNSIFTDKLESFKPDFVYIHNTWFKLSLGIFKILKKNNIKTVLKIHNFRYECGRYWLLKNHLKNNNYCPACSKQFKKFLIFNKYYEESFLKSIFLILYSKKYFKILKNNPIKIFVLSNFHYKTLTSTGVNSKKVNLFYNPISTVEEQVTAYNPKSNFVVYAGRLTESKGLYEMLNAWVKADMDKLELQIFGAGDLSEILKSKFSYHNISFYDEVDNDIVLEKIKRSRAVMTATKMYEGQPRLLSEASIHGVPSIYPNFGSMPEFFPKDYPFAFKQFDYESLSRIIRLLNDENFLNKTSKILLKHFQKLLSNENMQNQFNSGLH